ncbi:hypothetical protein FQN52_007844 [Onygenales sp. PD_12]|nr:hypothetical protein FQN53_005290 [Emmonsiellopsis sp. PD_33]KAK2786387.1 hypothetical protein FQN52_007844 [Onygenales sp. PD_12]
MIKQTIFTLIAGIAAVTAVTAPSNNAPAHPPFDAAEKSLEIFTHLENKNLDGLGTLLHPNVIFSLPMSFNGNQDPARYVVGKNEVIEYLKGPMDFIEVIDFVDFRTTVADNGKTTFLQCKGQFTTAEGTPYLNVYIYRCDWDDNGLLINFEEYTNPMTYCKSFEDPDCPPGLYQPPQ